MAKEKTKKQRETEIKRAQYKERAKRMRVLFRDEFSAKNGFDLRKVDSWTPAQKAKVTKYFRVVAPRITGDFVVKRYRRSDNLEAAVRSSLQEKLLPGQTAAAFSVDPGEDLTVKVREGKAIVARNGMRQLELMFDKAAFLSDPKSEIERVLAETDANVFRIIVGGQKQNKTLTRSDVIDEIVSLIENYSPENIRRDQGQRSFDEWLNGLIAYPGTEKRTFSRVSRFVYQHKKVMEKRERDRLDELSAERQGITVATVRRRRAARKKKKKKKRAKKKSRRRR